MRSRRSVSLREEARFLHQVTGVAVSAGVTDEVLALGDFARRFRELAGVEPREGG